MSNSETVTETKPVEEIVKGGVLVKTLLLVAVPIILGNLLESLTEIVDMHFIGTLGEKVMAGASAAISVTTLVLTFILGVGIAVSAYVSRAHGMKDKELIGKVLTNSFMIAIVLGIIFVIIGFSAFFLL